MSWSKAPVHWEDARAHYWSIVFSWDLWEWCQTVQPELDGKEIIVGGPAVLANPHWIPSWVDTSECPDALSLHNPLATRTTLGCIRQCGFCAVPVIEPEYKELAEWPVRPIVIDNNLLAASQIHFDRVIDRLKPLDWCDFNQGLDARLLTKYHAERFAELKEPIIRLAFDNTRTERAFLRAYQWLKDAGIPNRLLHCYVLIGYNDSPDDALYRLRTVQGLGIKPNPMRYQSLNAKQRNDYVQHPWTHQELTRYMRYWQNLRFTAAVPFEEWEG